MEEEDAEKDGLGQQAIRGQAHLPICIKINHYYYY